LKSVVWLAITIFIVSVVGWYQFTGRFKNMLAPIARWAIFSYTFNFLLKILAFQFEIATVWSRLFIFAGVICKGVVGWYLSSSWKQFIGVVWIGIILQIVCYSYLDLLVFFELMWLM
jgi:hypothetical protein